jgi:hypothetical protein
MVSTILGVLLRVVHGGPAVRRHNPPRVAAREGVSLTQGGLCRRFGPIWAVLPTQPIHEMSLRLGCAQLGRVVSPVGTVRGCSGRVRRLDFSGRFRAHTTRPTGFSASDPLGADLRARPASSCFWRQLPASACRFLAPTTTSYPQISPEPLPSGFAFDQDGGMTMTLRNVELARDGRVTCRNHARLGVPPPGARSVRTSPVVRRRGFAGAPASFSGCRVSGHESVRRT